MVPIKFCRFWYVVGLRFASSSFFQLLLNQTVEPRDTNICKKILITKKINILPLPKKKKKRGRVFIFGKLKCYKSNSYLEQPHSRANMTWKFGRIDWLPIKGTK